MLKVSRPPLREALRLLEAEKLIQLIPNRGPVVARIGVEEARELYALRGLLEGFAAHEFARLASDEQVALLGEKVKGLHVFLEHPDRKGLLAMKSQFYDVLLDGAGNRLINEVLTGLLSRVNLLRATSFSRPERLAQSLVEIDNLFEAIQRRDATQAQRLATLHIHNAQAVALAILEQN